MKKTYIIVLGILVALTLLFYALNAYIYQEKQGAGPAKSHKDASYVIDGQVVTLKDGVAEMESAPGSASKVVTRYFGNEVKTDLNKDGREDVVFLLTQETGGSGTFFYAAAAIDKESGFEGSQAVFIGDRIAPQTTEKGPSGSIIVNYADRNPGEDFSVRPSLGKSMRLLFDATTMQFGEVAQDFEGEADPSRMTLGMKKWTWISTLMNDGTEVVPGKKDAFTLIFNTDGSVSFTTDCNSGGGTYVPDENRITFGPMFSTKMFCEGSQESEFMRMVGDSTSYHFTSKGELILDITFDSGSVIFR